MRQTFDLLAFPLDGMRLIEASAGTGKTFSLAGLYLRLLVGKQLDVRDILVMTFTRAATQELRERIRTRLAAAAVLALDPARAEPGNVEHDLALAIIDAAAAREPRERIVRRLRDAATRMDDAAISTIHGFAQQAGQENAFDSALPFDRGTQVDDAEVHREVVTDYWRRHVLGRAPLAAAAFLDLWPSPDRMAKGLAPALERPHLGIWGPSAENLAVLTARARALWAEGCEPFAEVLRAAVAGKLLRTNEGLNQAIVGCGGVDGLLARLRSALDGNASGHVILPAWLGDLGTDEGVAKHVRKNGMSHCRPQDLALVQALAALAPVARVAAVRDALEDIRATIRSRKRAARQFSFADMIESLDAAITDPASGGTLAAALHRRWPYALVDEFQDTDPLQYRILRTIYRGREAGGLVMIGDPKQAIYGFRGGDVFAYLEAARDADGCYELDTNFRSTQGVLDGIDALFRGPAAQTPPGEFLVPDIRFHALRAGRAPDDHVLLRDGERLPAVTVWSVPGAELSPDEGRRVLLQATLSEICTLLDPRHGARVRVADGGERAVRAGDVAVLVNTNWEAAEVQRALAGYGVPSVCLHRASVFATEQAADLFLLLKAANRSARPDAVRAALVTPLLGLRMQDLLALDANEADWLAVLARFQVAHETWRGRGVLAMLEPFLQDAAPRILALEAGERRMTNYLQLAELLAHAETETFGPEGLIRWLAEQIENPQSGAEAENQQLRLESDAELVRIVTVHRVKGLEYPIVFVPFAPSLGIRRPAGGSPTLVFHDDERRAWLDPSGAEHRHQANVEARAECLRLLYVALTRARDACYFGWGSIRTAQNSALAWLLHPEAVDPGEVAAPNSRHPEWFDGATVDAALQAYAERAQGAVRVVRPPPPLEAGFRASSGSPPEGAARTDLPARRPDWLVFSFSRLVAGGRDRAPGAGIDDESPDPVPPAPTVLPAALPAALAATAAAGADIPLQGPAFGNAVHQLLESIDPARWPGLEAAPEDAHRASAAACLQSAGLPLGEGTARRATLDAVCRLVSRTLHTPLPAIGPLASVPAERRLVEMEFFLTLGGERIARILERLNGYGYAIALAPERAQQTLAGLMQGFVDLIVEADGRYWIIDYKTNRLPDYGPESLAAAVRHGHYDLQYLIYLVALHRHLGRTLSGYDPAQHLGGAQYLFLRGLDGVGAAAAGSAGAAAGVFIDSPPAELVLTLDDLFAGRSAAA